MEKLNKMIKEVETLEDGFKVEKDILLIRLKECKEELHKQLTIPRVVGTCCDDNETALKNKIRLADIDRCVK